jgi:pyrimidine deaminase RibD-like protein
MFARSRQELRNFASDERPDERFIELAVDSANQLREHSAAIVAAVISRLDEIVAEGLGRGIWRPDEAPAFSI